jgi:hypothetical protein
MFIKVQGPLDDCTTQFLAGKMERLTTPDKHDLNLVKFGQRIKVTEIAEMKMDNGKKRVEGRGGETTLHSFEKMIKELPANHNLGMIMGILGTDFIPNGFMEFLTKYAKLKKFSVVSMMGTRTTKEVFDNFDDPYGKPAGTA